MPISLPQNFSKIIKCSNVVVAGGAVLYALGAHGAAFDRTMVM